MTFQEKVKLRLRRHKKKLLSSCLVVIVFLLVRYSSLQERIIFQVGPYDDKKKQIIHTRKIANLSDEALKKMPTTQVTTFHSFVIHDPDYPDIQGYFWRRAQNRELRQEDKKIMIYFKGNAESFIEVWSPQKYESLYNAYKRYNHDTVGFDIVEMDYPSTGASAGQVRSDEDLRLFARRCYEYVVSQGYQQVILHGYSLGTFSASYVAAHYHDDPRIKMLILDSGFTSLPCFKGYSLALFLWPILRYRLSNIGNISHVKCPIFIRHGREDSV
ncbi:MAG: hypothetical protein AAF770_03970, partial [Bacteroidota bacterium]